MKRAPAVRTWIGFFRGINVGGRNRLPMKELVALLVGEGFDEVRTYIQSGNVVFRSAGTERAIGERILAAVAHRFGFRPHLLLLSAADLARAAAANPYPEACGKPQYLHLWFLVQAPTAAAARSLEAVRAPSERWTMRDRVLYLHAPQGIGRSKLAARAEALPAGARAPRAMTHAAARNVGSVKSIAGRSLVFEADHRPAMTITYYLPQGSQSQNSVNLTKRRARARRKAKANRLLRWQRVPLFRAGGIA